MFKILFLILVAACSTVFSQEVGSQNYEAQKIDEFGPLANCDLGARLDYLLMELMKSEGATGYVIIYQGTDVLPANYESNPRERFFRNQIMFRKFDASRIVFINGGFREELATELWIVPKGADVPKPTATIPKPKISLAKTFLYDRGSLDFEYSDFLNEFLLPEKKAELERERAELEKEFQTDEKSVEEIEDEPVIENIEIEKPSAEEIENEKFQWLSEKFGEFLKKNEKVKGVIIFYADDLEYDTGKLWNLVEEGRKKISKQSKLSPDRIQILYGGYRPFVEMEFYVMPENGEFPMPKPEERIVEEETEEQ